MYMWWLPKHLDSFRADQPKTQKQQTGKKHILIFIRLYMIKKVFQCSLNVINIKHWSDHTLGINKVWVTTGHGVGFLSFQNK